MPFYMIEHDITTIEADAIVNAANTSLAAGGGVCGAIFYAAGHKELDEACAKLAPIKTGEAVITPGFALPAKYIIHTAGPIYQDGCHNEAKLLSACYTNSLLLAKENQCHSIAFPIISAGIYGYPLAEAKRLAKEAIVEFLNQNDDYEMTVYLTVIDRKMAEPDSKTWKQLEAFLNRYYQPSRHTTPSRGELKHEYVDNSRDIQAIYQKMMAKLDDPFAVKLMRIIQEKGLTDAQVYKKANMDRRLFSKIRKYHTYTPGKATILSLAIALELSKDATDELLRSAGYALSGSQRQDVIIAYFLEQGEYDIFAINEALLYAGETPLGY